MKKIINKIEGVKPFNLLTLQNCYVHQLIAGAASFGIPYENILIGYFSFPKKDFQIEKKHLTDKEMGKIWGYRRKECNLSLKEIVSNIDKHNPVIIGVDCFFLEGRPDSYQKRHCPHWILIYGYDFEHGTFNAVDQNYSNSYRYAEKKLSIENVLYANKMYRLPPLKRKKSCRVLIKKKPKENGIIDMLEKIEWRLFESSKKISEKNLNTLNELISTEDERLQGKSSEITTYLQEMKYSFSILKRIDMFTDTQEKKTRVSFIGAAYSNLLSMFWKMESKKDYSFIFRYKDNVQQKINDLMKVECIAYNDILEKCKCLQKK